MLTSSPLDQPQEALWTRQWPLGMQVGIIQSSLPKTGSGALLIDGHVKRIITPGVFFAIDTLSVGDTMQIERGDGEVYAYSVVVVEQKKIEAVDMAKMMRSITPGKQDLNLITCGGEYDSRRGTFDDRILVYAHQVN